MPVVASFEALPATVKPRAYRLMPVKAGSRQQNPYTLEPQIIDWPGEGWSVKLEFPPLQDAAARDLEAWLANLCRGTQGALIGPYTPMNAPRGTWAGTPVVDGANQIGNVLALRGFTANAVGAVVAGDWVACENRLYLTTTSEDADGAGKLAVGVFPTLKPKPGYEPQELHGDGASIVKVDPLGAFLMRLPAPEMVQTPGGFFELEGPLELIEYL